jgi:hypothetical protein
VSEATEQEALFHYLAIIAPRVPAVAWAFHCPNGEKRDKAVAARLQAMGVKAGVPDVLLPVRSADGRYVGLAIELKHGQNVATREQEAWLTELERQGWMTLVCYDWTQAARYLLRYLGEDPSAHGLKSGIRS